MKNKLLLVCKYIAIAAITMSVILTCVTVAFGVTLSPAQFFTLYIWAAATFLLAAVTAAIHLTFWREPFDIDVEKIAHGAVRPVDATE